MVQLPAQLKWNLNSSQALSNAWNATLSLKMLSSNLNLLSLPVVKMTNATTEQSGNFSTQTQNSLIGRSWESKSTQAKSLLAQCLVQSILFYVDKLLTRPSLVTAAFSLVILLLFLTLCNFLSLVKSPSNQTWILLRWRETIRSPWMELQA